MYGTAKRAFRRAGIVLALLGIVLTTAFAPLHAPPEPAQKESAAAPTAAAPASVHQQDKGTVDAANTEEASPPAQSEPLAQPEPPAQSEDDRREIADLKQKIDQILDVTEFHGNFVTWFGGYVFVLTLVLSVLGIFAYWSAHRQSSQAFQLLRSGETAAQLRAEETHQQMFDRSVQTLDLVNQTLGLAKEASERAAKVNVEQARGQRDELDDDARHIIHSAESPFEIIRALKDKRALEGLVREIQDYDRHLRRLNLDSKTLDDLELTPHCRFVLALDAHIEERYENAVKIWRKAVESAPGDGRFAAVCHYFVGIAHNNTGRYRQAIDQFRQAQAELKDREGEIAFEIERILLETDYFSRHASIYAVQELKPQFDNLIARIEGDVGVGSRFWAKAKTTYGNALLGLALERKDSAGMDATTLGWLKDAQQQYADVQGRLQETGQTPFIWASFGLAQTLWEFEDPNLRLEAAKLYESVEQQIRRYLSRRFEDRSRVLGWSTEFICYCRLDKYQDARNSRAQISEHLADITEDAHLYSQIVMRNVSKSEFAHQINTFYSDVLDRG